MGKSPSGLGARLRALRRRHQLTQAALADRLGISASYLNLIEHGRRPLTAELLIKLAGVFDLDIRSFAPDSDARIIEDLMEAFGDPIFEGHALTNSDIQDFASQAPGVARAVLSLYESLRQARDTARSARVQLRRARTALDDAGVELEPESIDGAPPEEDDEPFEGLEPWRLPSEEVNDFLQRHGNHFASLEEAAESLWVEAGLELDHLYTGLVRHLADRHGIEVRVARGEEAKVMRYYDQGRRRLHLSELLTLPTRTFQLAHQLALLTLDERLDALSDDQHLTTDASRTLCRVAMANYFAGAVLMPYGLFIDAARALRYDIETLCHRFQVGFEQVCHRLTTLRRPGAEGIPFHFMKVDIAGNISKRFSASGISFARFSGACPRWNLVAAFLTPGRIRRQLSAMPDGRAYFCVARTVTKRTGGANALSTVHAITLGCEVHHARHVVYADGMDLDSLDAAVPIGVTCRLCERTDCEQRVHPALTRPLLVDENRRGFSFYAPLQRPAPPSSRSTRRQ